MVLNSLKIQFSHGMNNNKEVSVTMRQYNDFGKVFTMAKYWCDICDACMKTKSIFTKDFDTPGCIFKTNKKRYNNTDQIEKWYLDF